METHRKETTINVPRGTSSDPSKIYIKLGSMQIMLCLKGIDSEGTVVTYKPGIGYVCIFKDTLAHQVLQVRKDIKEAGFNIMVVNESQWKALSAGQ